MKHLINKVVQTVSLMAALTALFTVFATTTAYANVDCSGITDAAELASCQRKADVCEGAGAAGVTNCGSAEEATTSFKSIIQTIVNILSVIVGAVSVIMIIIGGFRYVVSAGDSNAMSGAKNTILYAIVGLVIVLFAQIIVAFVIDRATAPPAEATVTVTRNA